MIGNGVMRKTDMPEHPLGGAPAFYEFNCTAFEIEVDTDTGEILVHKHVTVGDVGKAINPVQVESQDEGAAIMGLGPHPHGARPARRHRPDPQPRNSGLPHPHHQGRPP